jgi:hypothetical protein
MHAALLRPGTTSRVGARTTWSRSSSAHVWLHCLRHQIPPGWAEHPWTLRCQVVWLVPRCFLLTRVCATGRMRMGQAAPGSPGVERVSRPAVRIDPRWGEEAPPGTEIRSGSVTRRGVLHPVPDELEGDHRPVDHDCDREQREPRPLGSKTCNSAVDCFPPLDPAAVTPTDDTDASCSHRCCASRSRTEAVGTQGDPSADRHRCVIVALSVLVVMTRADQIVRDSSACDLLVDPLAERTNRRKGSWPGELRRAMMPSVARSTSRQSRTTTKCWCDVAVRS